MKKLKKFAEQIEKMRIKHAIKVDASQFGDPMAETIDWYPMKPGGANFATHTLKKTSASSLKYGPSIGSLLFCGVFILVGVSMVLFGLGLIVDMEGGAKVILTIVGSIFALAGGLFLKHLWSPIHFDGMYGCLWKGNVRPQLAGNVQDKNRVLFFNEIHAIQVLAEYVRSDKSSYYSYEINFVLKDGNRFHVVDHGNRARILEDVETLSNLINKPVWNTIKYPS